MTTLFKERLREIRERREMSVTRLAAEIGRTELMVRYYEKGVVTPPMGIIYSLAAALDVPVTDLVNDDVRFGDREAR